MKQNDLHFIGLTGAAGSGKSMVLRLMEEDFGAKVLEADRIAEDLCAVGGECLPMIKEAFPDAALYREDGSMDRQAFGGIVFRDENKRNQINRIVHPAVKRYIINCAEQERKNRETSLLILEAALLLQEGYDRICDEIWYVYSPEDVRRQRLKETRGYSDEKIDQIFNSQLSDLEFRERCAAVLDNTGTKEETAEVLKKLIDERLFKNRGESK